MNRRNIYKKIISDVAMEISISNYWRKKIFRLDKDSKLYISKENANVLPEYIKEDVLNNDLEFSVRITDSCEEQYDDGLIIFEFLSEEYPDIKSYSGNNPDVQ